MHDTPDRDIALPARRSAAPRIGLALAGGGPEGAVYEIGALRALEEAVVGLDLNELEVYVGVSAGAFVSACLANGLTTAQLCRAVVHPGPGEHPFFAEVFFTPAVREIFGRSVDAPRLVIEAISEFLANPRDLTLLDSLTRLARAMPVALFDNEPVRMFLERVFSLDGRTDDFRKLRASLNVVAVDLDSGEAVRFGSPGFDDVPISRAVQASSALPGVYPPTEINGRYYVDGVLIKTLHASVALDAGCEVVLCINPIVPVDTADAVRVGAMRTGKLVTRGLPTVLSQTFRTLVHSRLKVGLSNYEPRYPGASIVLLEPSRDDYRMFFTNIFRFSSRKEVCEHAYQSTRRQLLARKDELGEKLARHGLTLNVEALRERRDLWRQVGLRDGVLHEPVTDRLDRALEKLETLID